MAPKRAATLCAPRGRRIRISSIGDVFDAALRNEASLGFDEYRAAFIGNERLQFQYVAPRPFDASFDVDGYAERNRFAKPRVHARRYAAVACGTGGMRHRFVEQRKCHAAVRDASPALKLRAQRSARMYAVVAGTFEV